MTDRLARRRAIGRLSFPEVVEDNDRLADLHRVANYLAGAKLPPIDYWLPYQRFNYYYTFRHYSGALLGRLFGLGPGESFTLAPIILPALVLGLAWEFLTLVRVRLWAKLLSIAALAIGGTGISPLLHFVASPSSPNFFSYESAVEALIYNSRLLGLFDSSVATGTWQAVFAETPRAVRLPIETFGYQYAIGGYHAVLAGFLLQFLALTIWRTSGARLRPSAPGSNSSLVSRYRLRFARMPGSFPSRRRWSVPGRCGTGAAQAPGTCATSRPVPVPGAAPASLSRRDQQRNRLHASRIRVPGSAHTARAVSGRVVAVSGAGACCRAFCAASFVRRIPGHAVCSASRLHRVGQRSGRALLGRLHSIQTRPEMVGLGLHRRSLFDLRVAFGE
ncbi:MAG: DUF2298 domain-containing protein [Methyloceanibacter sp.]